MMEIRRPALRYHGGKWRLRKWVIQHLPAHQHYVEVYGGAGSVLIAKGRSNLETYNDINGEVVNFFRILRERPQALIDQLQLTPWAREELEYCRLPIPENHPDPDLERARRLFAESWMGRGKATSTMSNGWRYEKSTLRGSRNCAEFSTLDRLHQISGRFQGVQIECTEALALIERFDSPETLFYLDPPYLPETRSRRWRASAYAHEMSFYDHARLLYRLRSIQGMAVISGYPSALYDRFLEGWHQVQCQSATEGWGLTSAKKLECLWLCPKSQTRISIQTSLTL